MESRSRALFVCLELLKKLNKVNDIGQGQIVPYNKFYISDLKDKVNLKEDYLRYFMVINGAPAPPKSEVGI